MPSGFYLEIHGDFTDSAINFVEYRPHSNPKGWNITKSGESIYTVPVSTLPPPDGKLVADFQLRSKGGLSKSSIYSDPWDVCLVRNKAEPRDGRKNYYGV